MKFLKIQDKSQVNKNQERVKAYLFSYLLSYLPNILYFLRHDLSGIRNKIHAFNLLTVAVACYSC
jgi:hypothetical protein